MPTSTTVIQYGPGNFARIIRQEKIIKGVWNGKEEVKLFLFTSDMIPYIGESKHSTKRLLVLTGEFD